MAGFLLQATIYLAAAVISVPIAKKLGLGSVLGYLFAGVAIGPILGLVGSETQDLQHFAEFGVVMMLFIVGLELEPRALWDMRHRLLGLGGMQVGLTTLAIMGVCMLSGLTWPISLAIGLTFALSSTAIVVQTLNEKNLMQTPGGRSAFSVLLAQDIAVIPMLALLPLLAISGINNAIGVGPGDTHGGGHAGGDSSMSLIEGLPAWGVTLVTIGAIAVVILGGLYLTRPVFKFIAQSKLPEMFTAIALLMVVGIALLMTLVGLSPALGTFLAGVVLANSEFRHELENDIEPFKGLLLGLFFITVGAGINFELLFGDFVRIIGMALGVMLTKALVLLGLAFVFGLKGRDQLLFTLSLAQAGEFGFVMIATAISTNVVTTEMSQMLSLIVAISMFLTPLLFIMFDFAVARKSAAGGDTRDEDHIDEEGTILIIGMGRVGQIVNRMALGSGIKTIVIDNHVDHIDTMRRFGVKGYFGDPTRPDLMHTAGLMDAKVLIVAVDDKDAAVRLVEIARKSRPDLPIVARASGRNDVYRLYAAGATDIVRETFDSSVRMGSYMLTHMGWEKYDAERMAEEFTKADRGALLELAQLWDPKVDVFENKPYLEKAKEINAQFNTGFLANLAGLVDRNDEDETEEELTEDGAQDDPIK
ncbi:MAG: monovalent cation:proton antiporter-2 (CPA2) family protein [Pseudomonadota bacterium]